MTDQPSRDTRAHREAALTKSLDCFCYKFETVCLCFISLSNNTLFMNLICCFAKVGKQRRDSFAGWFHRGPGPSHRSNSEGEKAAFKVIKVIEL